MEAAGAADSQRAPFQLPCSRTIKPHSKLRGQTWLIEKLAIRARHPGHNFSML